VPALRERREDIVLLARYFLEKFCARSNRQISLSPESEKTLEQYRWPGNVRELENAIERAAALCDGDTIMPDDLPAKLHNPSDGEWCVTQLPQEGVDLDAKVGDFERSLIRQAMKKAVNSQTKAAQLLKLTPRSLRYKLDKYDMKNGRD
jgi:DNA-binding NtrC family response regulator